MKTVAGAPEIESPANETLSHRLSLFVVGSPETGPVQFFRYGMVAIVAAVVDTGSLMLFTNVFNILYLISNIISFVLGTTVNGILSISWAFPKSGRPIYDFFVLFGISILGLGVSEAGLWFGRDILTWDLFFAKMLALAAGFIWNFTLRRILALRAERKNKVTQVQ